MDRDRLLEPRTVRIMRYPGLWEELLECHHCLGQGVCEIEFPRPDYLSGSGFIDSRCGQCFECNGLGYLEDDFDDDEG